MKHGYWLAKGIFDHDEIDEILNNINVIFSQFWSPETGDEAIMNLFREDFNAFLGCAHLCRKLPLVYGLAASLNQTLIDHCGIRFPVLNTKPLMSFSSRHTAQKEEHWKVGPHQDWASNLGSTNGVTAWIPLQDVDNELGPLEVVPDSHLLGPLEHEGTPPVIKGRVAEDFFNYVPVPMEVGDVLFFRTMLIHRSGENITEDRIRKSLHFRYNDALEQSFIDRKYPMNRTGD